MPPIKFEIYTETNLTSLDLPKPCYSFKNSDAFDVHNNPKVQYFNDTIIAFIRKTVPSHLIRYFYIDDIHVLKNDRKYVYMVTISGEEYFHLIQLMFGEQFSKRSDYENFFELKR